MTDSELVGASVEAMVATMTSGRPAGLATALAVSITFPPPTATTHDRVRVSVAGLLGDPINLLRRALAVEVHVKSPRDAFDRVTHDLLDHRVKEDQGLARPELFEHLPDPPNGPTSLDVSSRRRKRRRDRSVLRHPLCLLFLGPCFFPYRLRPYP